MISLNQYLTRDPELDQQITIFLSRLDIQQGTLEYINAGHPPPLLFHSNGTYTRLEDGGPILGFDPDLEFEVGTVQLKKNDLLLLYTDGLSETTSVAGQMFDEQGIIGITRNALSKSPGEISETLFNAVREFTRRDTFEDDLTLLVARYLLDTDLS
jgi:sigma-B regulation protein RsbU (phosphoserine phosphatase)